MEKQEVQFSFVPVKQRKPGENFSLATRISIKVFNDFGMPSKAIAKVVCSTKRSVDKVLQKKGVVNEKGQGRPRKTTRKEDKKILKYCSKYRRRGTAILNPSIQRKYSIHLSARSIRNRLRVAGVWWGYQKTKHIMTKNDYSTRFDFAEKYKNKSWKRYDIHHDESFMNLSTNVRRERHFPTDNEGNAQKHWTNLKFECFVTSEWKSKLYFWTGRRNSINWVNDLTTYHKDLKEEHTDVRLNKCKWWFDKAPCHKSGFSCNYYNLNRINFELFCNKPVEINVCERIWGRIKQYAWSKNPKTLKDTKRYLKREYNRITQVDLRKMFSEIPKRVKEVSKNNGAKSHYWTDHRLG